ncbi:MAG: AMP-binding protein [Paludibacteraceae bacterium]|nr:AMP-binding protein [Paludibacteraceae bacterium]
MVKENFIQTIESSIVQNWSMVAFSDYGTSVSLKYQNVAQEIERIHILLEQCGIKPDDKVALMGRNNSSWVTTYLAILTYGAIVVPILQDFKPNDTLHILNHSESKLFFVTDVLYETMDIDQMEYVEAVLSLTTREPLSVKSSLFTAEDITSASIEQIFQQKYPGGITPEKIHYTQRDNSCTASINYTSGTTGFSKGVVTRLNALAGNVKFCSENHVIYRGSRQVVFLPLAHAFGCAFDFLTSFCVGAHAYFLGKTPSPRVLLEAFKEVKPTCIFTVPLILEKIYQKQILPFLNKSTVNFALKLPLIDDVLLGKIRQQLIEAFGGKFDEIIVGGAPMNADVEAFLQKIHFPYTVGYGMTECAPLISYSKHYTFREGSCGKILEGLMEVKLDNVNADGIGEILVRGEHVMSCYYKNQEATNEVFTADGWLKTGDLGYIDEDGFIFIKGRNKTMFLGPNGQNIYPEEIEAKLNNMPYVMESLVIEQDHNIVALVCPDFETVDTANLTKSQLDEVMEQNRKMVNGLLASYEQISAIKIYPHEFEKTPKKSIKRFLYTHF